MAAKLVAERQATWAVARRAVVLPAIWVAAKLAAEPRAKWAAASLVTVLRATWVAAKPVLVAHKVEPLAPEVPVAREATAVTQRRVLLAEAEAAIRTLVGAAALVVARGR